MLLALKVTVLVDSVVGLPKIAVTPDGNPEAARFTVPVFPFVVFTATVLDAFPLGANETLEGDAESVKLAALCFNVTSNLTLVVAN